MTLRIQQLFALITDGEIEIIDLTQTLSANTPVISLPPPYAQTASFRVTPIAKYDEGCPFCYWNNISLGEHTGTHLDAPAHWISGRNYPDGFTDSIASARFVAPACVIDCTDLVAQDAGFILEPEHIQSWEGMHGRIPAGAWVLMRTGWSMRTDAKEFLNVGVDGPRSPGPSPEVMRLLVERKINGFGVETVGTDAGQAMRFQPPFPCHEIGLGGNVLGLASLTNLHLLPPTGSLLVVAPLKMEHGSGSPVRAFALVDRSSPSPSS